MKNNKEALALVLLIVAMSATLGISIHFRANARPRAGQCYKDLDGFSVQVLDQDQDGISFKWTDEGFNSPIFPRSYESDVTFKQKFTKCECPNK